MTKRKGRKFSNSIIIHQGKTKKNTTVWVFWGFNFILGSNFIYLCFQLIIIIILPNPKTKENKFEPRIKLNHNRYMM